MVDELGLKADYEALICASGCGIHLLASIHGNDFEDILKKHMDKEELLKETFQRFIILSWQRKNGKFRQKWLLLDERGERLAEKEKFT